MNECGWLHANKTLFKEIACGLYLVWGPWFADLRLNTIAFEAWYSVTSSFLFFPERVYFYFFGCAAQLVES